jgi:hypothetical protein
VPETQLSTPQSAAAAAGSQHPPAAHSCSHTTWPRLETAHSPLQAPLQVHLQGHLLHSAAPFLVPH